MKFADYSSAILLPLLGSGAIARPSHCRCRPNEDCWPSSGKWKALNESIDGNLVSVKPVGNVCHDPTFDKAACADATANKTNSVWRSQEPGAVQYVNWEAWPAKHQSCYIDTPRKESCGQGRISRYSAVVRNPKQIQKAVRFADKHNLRLVVKNTGHDFLGRSTAPDSLQILTHYMKDMDFVDDFVPEGSHRGRGSAVTIGAGVQLAELYKAAAKAKKTPVAGFAHTVGAAGGYLQGGGHSPLGPWKGMAADNVLEFKVVTAKGDLVTANDYKNKDLFWALRGGGGGTFGIVTSATLRTFPDPRLTVVDLNFTMLSAPNESYWKAVEAMHANLPTLSDAGASGYYWVTPNVLMEGQQIATGSFLLMFVDKTAASADKACKPLVSTLKGIPGIYANYSSYSFPSFTAGMETFLGFSSSDPTGSATILGSRLVSRKLFTSKDGPAKFTKVVSKLFYPPGRSFLGHLIAGGQVAKNKHIDIGLNPVWRRALNHVAIPGGWPTNSTIEEQQKIQSHLTNVEVPMLKKLEPDMGAYPNEADGYEKDFQQSFWGSNYRRLYAIKKKWDPKSLFIVRSGVGSEYWDEEGFCRVR